MKGRECKKCHTKRGTQEVVPEWECPGCGYAYSKTGSIELTKEEREKANKELKEKNRKYLIKRKNDSINESGRKLENIILIALILFLSSVGAGCFLRFDIALVILSLFAAFIGWAYTYYKKEEFKESLIENQPPSEWDSLSHKEKLAKAKKNFALRIKRKEEKERKKTYLHSIYIPDVFKKLFWIVLCVAIISIMEYREQPIRGIAQSIIFNESEIAQGTIVGRIINRHRGRYGGISEYYRIQYSYKVNGEYYSSTHFSNAPLGHDLERVINSYNIGDKVNIYYDSNFPSVSVVEKLEPTTRSYVALVGALFFLSLGIWMYKD